MDFLLNFYSFGVFLTFSDIDFYSLSCFYEAGKRNNINPVVLLSIAKVESNLRKNAINKNANGTYDIGIMQVNSFWLKRYKFTPQYISHSCTNIYFGAYILKQCFDRFGYSWKGIDCYNKGLKAKHNSRYVMKVKKEMENFLNITTQAFWNY
ncbi:MAG: lytic transglycosylase domain-containing protein [Nanopusillaceae archaeon]